MFLQSVLFPSTRKKKLKISVSLNKNIGRLKNTTTKIRIKIAK